MQIICTSLQTDNQASTSPLSFSRPDALPATQPTASIHFTLYSILSHFAGTRIVTTSPTDCLERFVSDDWDVQPRPVSNVTLLLLVLFYHMFG